MTLRRSLPASDSSDRISACALRRALDDQLTVRDACDRWYSGAFLLETVPSALYILARQAGNPETAITRAVNDTKDNDTIAAIIGAAVGAPHGRFALPSRWVDGLLGRMAESDDGRVFELIAHARERWT
jgi:ADP-ribosyl-[dinitrogen reductase] hydrolase